MGGTLWANGDPVATFCALTLSRNPLGVHVPEVQLKDEYLTVTPEGRYTLVRVEYLLYNNSKKDFANLPYTTLFRSSLPVKNTAAIPS